jgi:hypothetical protein
MNEINNRLNEILESSIIIDTLSHGPLLWSDDLIKACDEMLAQEMNPWDVIPILALQFARERMWCELRKLDAWTYVFKTVFL